MSIRTFTLAALTTLATIAGTLAYTATPALAGLGFAFPPFGYSLIEDPITDSGTYFEQGHAVAVDSKNGDILVTNQEEHLEVLNAAGEHIGTLTGKHTPAGSFEGGQIAVNDSTGLVYVICPHQGVVDVVELVEAGPVGKRTIEEGNVEQITGTPAGHFHIPTGVAVDQTTGDVYVLNEPESVFQEPVYVFDSSGKFKFQITEASVPGGESHLFNVHLAVDDKTGELLVSGVAGSGNSASAVVYVFTLAGEYLATWTGHKTPAQTFRPNSGFNLSLAADNGSGYVYVTDAAHGVVDVFDPTNAPEEDYKAQIRGIPAEPYEFESGKKLSGVAVAQASGEVLVLYEFKAKQTVLDVFGAPTPLPSPIPRVPSGVLTGSATLEGSVNPEGHPVIACVFEYGVSEAYGYTQACLPGAGSLGEGLSPVGVSASTNGLEPGSEYHYRIAASSAGGTEHSIDQRLVTAPELGAESASGVSQFAAILHAQIEPGEVPTSYRFVYGTTQAYGAIAPVPDGSLPVARGQDEVSQPLTGLAPGVEYHYAVQASSAAGTFTGLDQTFITPSAPAPSVSTGGTSGVGVGGATLAGTVDPHGWDSTYAFQYGTSAAYGSQWPTVAVDLGGLSGAQPVTIALANLLPGTTYHYRLVAGSAGGTSYGADQTFTTGEYPVSIVQAPVVFETFVLPPEQSSVTVKAKKKKKGKAGKHKRGGKGKKARVSQGKRGRAGGGKGARK